MNKKLFERLMLSMVGADTAIAIAKFIKFPDQVCKHLPTID
jgi:hypothetical protein